MKKHLKPMVGFTKGIVLLALTYVLIGAVDGNPNYTEEIMKLTDYRYLLAQVIFAGMSGVIIAYMVAFFIEFTKKGTNGKVPKVKDLAIYLVQTAVAFGLCFVISNLLDRRGTLNGYVGSIFYGLATLAMCIVILTVAIKYSVENAKINRELRRRNSKRNQENTNEE